MFLRTIVCVKPIRDLVWSCPLNVRSPIESQGECVPLDKNWYHLQAIIMKHLKDIGVTLDDPKTGSKRKTNQKKSAGENEKQETKRIVNSLAGCVWLDV